MEPCAECRKRPQKYGRLRLCGACYERQRPKTPREKSLQRERSRRYKEANRQAIRDQTNQARWATPEAVEQRRAIERESYRRHRHERLERTHQTKALYLGLLREAVDWLAIHERDKGICQLCREPVPFAEMSLDHRVPLALGGVHATHNCQTAHVTCNRRKNARMQ
jgi:5-methylcytosine-specific restriction endonuclease McrA